MRSFGKEGICLMQLCLFIVRRADLKCHVRTRLIIGMVYNGSVGVVCPTHILDEKGGSSKPPRTPLRTPLLVYILYTCNCVQDSIHAAIFIRHESRKDLQMGIASITTQKLAMYCFFHRAILAMVLQGYKTRPAPKILLFRPTNIHFPP